MRTIINEFFSKSITPWECVSAHKYFQSIFLKIVQFILNCFVFKRKPTMISVQIVPTFYYSIMQVLIVSWVDLWPSIDHPRPDIFDGIEVRAFRWSGHQFKLLARE